MIGRTVAGRFYLEHLAGAGGMGAVYRARDITDGAMVAVKILTGRELREAERFDLEAAILADLTHPAIVRYIAHGVEGSDHFIAMEWLDGEDLATRLDRQALPFVDSVAMARRAAEALAHAHARGIVHRDIKPENLFLPGAEISRLKVLDFGIARLTRGGRKLTLTGSVIGTPGYMAPELVRGERNIRPSADVFSLGCVLFHCLTGRAVFEAEEATALLAKILLQDAPHAKEFAPGLPDAIDEAVARMLAKDPANRLPDASAVIQALDKAVAGAGAMERLVTTDQRRRAQPALTVTEQRVACVVIAGPTPTAEQRWYGSTPSLGVRSSPSPRATSSPLDAGHVQELADEIERGHGGRMHPLPDGSVVIVLPDAGKPPDQAARAARCALAVRARFPDVPLVVSTGPGRFSAWDVVGDVIDSGMRLLRGTAPGAIRLDDMAVGLLDARFEIRRDGTAAFLRSERDVFEVKRNLLGKASDFVGRGREMSMLSNYFTSAIAEQEACAVLVTGAAGVGKSRLRQEFVEWVGKQEEGAEVLFGIGDSLGAGSPFAMIGLALRRAAGIGEGEPIDERRRKLVERVSRHVAREVVPRVAAFLGEIANVPFPDEHNEALKMARQNPQVMGDAMRRSWEDWLAAECTAHPVLLLLEDLHWGDLGTVSFVDGALRNLRDKPLMVLAMARPDVQQRFPDLWSGRGLQTVNLGGLSKRASEKLVREALGAGVTDALVEQLIARADGNAFYLEELVRATAAGRQDALPDSVIGMVQARLDAEGVEARRVLRAASVFGERFSRGGVAALLGGEAEEAHVSEWLELLASRELVARAATAERRGDVEYTFTHALVREAAYAMLTQDDRALGHRLAGAWLEDAGSSDAMALAEHFRRGAEPGRAVRWYERAAEQALKANDLSAAIERAELGLSCGATGEVAGALRLVEAEAHVWRGEFADAERLALGAAEARTAGSSAALRALGAALVSAAKQGKLDVVEEVVRRVSEVRPEAGAGGAQISCLAWGATYLIFGGRIAAADALMVLVSELSRGLPDLDPQAQALIQQVRSFRASAAGDLGGCLAGLESALVSFEMAGDLRNACSTRANLGYMYSELGDFSRAEAALRKALAETERMGLHELTAAVQHNLGRVLGLRGQLPEAARLEREAIASVRKQGEPRVEGVARTYLAEILAAGGDYAGAEAEAAAAVEALRVAPSLRVAALGALARSRLGRGDAASALEVSREAASELAALGEIEEGESSVRLTHAEALAQNGFDDDARAALETARERLLARAARIEDRAWRERFLNDVPVNARILSLAEQWSSPGTPTARPTTGERPRRPTGTGPVRAPSA